MNRNQGPRSARSTNRPTAHRTTGGTCLAVLLGALLLASCGSSDAARPSAPSTTATTELGAVSGLGAATMPPWPVPDDPQTRAELAGLPMGPEGMAEHYHPMLSITVDGEAVEVPANIGIDLMTGQMSALHTHTPDGVIHIESAVVGEAFTLGQLFTEWNVKLGQDQLGGLGTDGSGTLKVTVDGAPYRGDPAVLVLRPEQRIDLEFTSAP